MHENISLKSPERKSQAPNYFLYLNYIQTTWNLGYLNSLVMSVPDYRNIPRHRCKKHGRIEGITLVWQIWSLATRQIYINPILVYNIKIHLFLWNIINYLSLSWWVKLLLVRQLLKFISLLSAPQFCCTVPNIYLNESVQDLELPFNHYILYELEFHLSKLQQEE